MRKTGRWLVLLMPCAMSLLFGVAVAQPRLKDGFRKERLQWALHADDGTVSGGQREGECRVRNPRA